jgi:DNA polymerase III epsilon subunit-like protein
MKRKALDPCSTATKQSPLTFVGLDFETADHGADSACAVGLVRVEDDRIIRREHYLIRPTRNDCGIFAPQVLLTFAGTLGFA